jgi:hypothetical protein
MHDYGLRPNHWISRRRCAKKASAIPPRPGSAECFEMVAPNPRVQSDKEERRRQSARAARYPDSPTNSKAAGQVSNRQLCLRPPHRADSPHTAPVGLPNRHEERWLFTVAPTLPFKMCGGGPVRPEKCGATPGLFYGRAMDNPTPTSVPKSAQKQSVAKTPSRRLLVYGCPQLKNAEGFHIRQ